MGFQIGALEITQMASKQCASEIQKLIIFPSGGDGEQLFRQCLLCLNTVQHQDQVSHSGSAWHPAGSHASSLLMSCKRICLWSAGKPGFSLRNSFLEQKLLFIKCKSFQATHRCHQNFWMKTYWRHLNLKWRILFQLGFHSTSVFFQIQPQVNTCRCCLSLNIALSWLGF